ncbi:MAG: M23 family metallopeptidase [Trueperaceae bacterium]
MRRRQRLLLTLLLVAGAVLAGLAISAALRDTTAPQVYVETTERLAASSPWELFASADEPVTYRLVYGDETLEEIAQDTTFTVPAAAGRVVAILSATDGAGNVTELELVVFGVPQPRLELTASDRLRSGDPLGVRLQVVQDGGDPELLARVGDIALALDGTLVPTLATADGGKAILAAPLAVEPRTLHLEATVTDEFGRTTTTGVDVVVDPLPVTIEQLAIDAATLAVITPEGRELEARAWAAAWADLATDPRWRDTFVAPIEGVSTSGFGDARRYAPGGPVSFHNGLDLAAPTGTPVHATNEGRVVVAGAYPIKGGWVAIDHGGGVMSMYFHMSKVLVEVGDEVARGAVIGEVGSTGLSTGPHLHWEMRVRELPTSPTAWVDRTFP